MPQFVQNGIFDVDGVGFYSLFEEVVVGLCGMLGVDCSGVAGHKILIVALSL